MKKTILLTFSLFIILLMQAQTSTAPTTGDGSSGNPYQIATLDNLYWLSQTIIAWDKYYIQTTNIDASATAIWDTCYGFSPIGNIVNAFTGNYNGQGYTINGLTINRPTTKNIGLFGVLQGTVENIQLKGSSITGHFYVGGVVGRIIDDKNITNCFSSGSVSGTARVGGVVGGSNGTINSCYNACAVSASDMGGGVAGYNSGTLTNCYNKGSVTGGTYIGGIVGSNNSKILNCYNTGAISNTNNISGGIAGYNNSNLYNCYNAGIVSGTISGIVFGDNSGTINRCYWDNEVSTIDGGTNYGTIFNSIGKTTAEMQSADFVTLLNTYKGIYANWISVSGGYPTFGFAITYNLNGGTNNPANTETYECGTGLTLSSPTQTDYVFIGWYDNAAFAGAAITKINPLATTNITLYAKWEYTYTITYNLDGGINNPANASTYTYGIEFTLSNPTKTGYTFDGWYDNPGLNGTAVTSISSFANSAITLYAKWTANTYSIAYNLDGGDNNASNAPTYTYGVGMTIGAATKTEYIFAGWYDNENFTGTAVTEISNTTTGDVTLYAKWTEITNTFTITVSAGDKGSITPTGEISVNAGSSQSFTISANKGYHISNVLVDGASVGAISSYTFSNVTANHTIAASFKLTTSIGNATTENINLYPNPASDYIIIEGAEGTTSLFDISGRMVLTQTVSNLSTINISSLTNGIYILSINGQTLKVIKK